MSALKSGMNDAELLINLFAYSPILKNLILEMYLEESIFEEIEDEMELQMRSVFD